MYFVESWTNKHSQPLYCTIRQQWLNNRAWKTGILVSPIYNGCLLYVFYQKVIIQGHPGHRCPTREALGLGSRIVFRAVLSQDISTQTVFLYYMSVNDTLRGYLWCFFVSMIRTDCYVKHMKWNQHSFSALHRLYIWGHSWILVLLLIFVDRYKHSNTTVSDFKSILNRFGCIIWRQRRMFIKISTFHNRLHNTFVCCIFLFGLEVVFNLAYINYSLCRIWSVNMQYLRCCDHSDESLFLIIQQAEVLLNVFGECICFFNTIWSVINVSLSLCC